jgi:FlaG/FlaF family flagellin (archaellin)
MPQSRLFISSVSRRDVARRKPGGPRVPVALLVAIVLLAAAAVAAFALGHGGL